MKLLLSFLLVSITTCGQINVQSKQLYNLTVKIDNLKQGDTVYLSYNKYINDKPSPFTDTLIFQADKLVFTGDITEPAEAMILRYTTEKIDTVAQRQLLNSFPGSEEERKEIEEYFLNPRKMDMLNFFLVPGETTVKTSKLLRKAKLEGSTALTEYLELKKNFETMTREMYENIDDDFNPFSKTDDAAMERITKQFDSINRITLHEVYFKYAQDHPSSLVALYALQHSLPKTIDTVDKFISVFDKLSPEIREWQSAKELKHKLEAIRKTEIGKIIEDFNQTDVAGKQIKFSSYRGKYVLIELWASWCMPCRKKNPGLVQVQQKFGGKNFTILGVALEQPDDKDKWLKAIQKDGLTWPQLTDYKFWNNAVAKQFGIQSIPFNVLVDPNGKIIAKNIYGAELETMLASFLPL
jgi:thiol-disulfide isomerase/thioredoxin